MRCDVVSPHSGGSCQRTPAHRYMGAADGWLASELRFARSWGSITGVAPGATANTRTKAGGVAVDRVRSRNEELGRKRVAPGRGRGRFQCSAHRIRFKAREGSKPPDGWPRGTLEGPWLCRLAMPCVSQDGLVWIDTEMARFGAVNWRFHGGQSSHPSCAVLRTLGQRRAKAAEATPSLAPHAPMPHACTRDAPDWVPKRCRLIPSSPIEKTPDLSVKAPGPGPVA